MFVAAAAYVLLSSVFGFYLLSGGFGVRTPPWRLLLILFSSQAMLFGLRSEFRYFDVAGDPADREHAGRPQLGRRSGGTGRCG